MNGLTGKIVNAFKSMYEAVKSKVRAGSDLTEACMCPQGLKQGEVGSPVLFPLFIHELTKDIVEGGKHGIQLSPELIELLILLFADDIVLCADSVIGLQTQLNVLCDSARRLDLIMNLDKSTIVVFRNGDFLTTRENVFFNNSEVKVVNMYKDMGIYSSSRLTFSYAFNKMRIMPIKAFLQL